MKNVFIRGSVVRYVHLPGQAVDTALLEDATRRGRLKLPALPLEGEKLTWDRDLEAAAQANKK